MVHIVGAGCGAPDLITVRGQRFLKQADVIIYAGSLVNPQILLDAKPGCQIYNSAKMTLEEIIETIKLAEINKKMTVRLHTGDPSIYGAIREQIDQLNELKIDWDVTPGVSSFCGAAAALGVEYTLPEVSQTVMITRMEGRTPVPEKEEIAKLAAHHSTMVIFLSAGMTEKLSKRLIEGGFQPDTPAAIVYKASWPEEKKVFCTIEELPIKAKEHQITKTALILVGDFLGANYERSKLYDPSFTTEYREASK